MYPPSHSMTREPLELKPAGDKTMIKRLGTALLIFGGITIISFLAGRCPDSEIDKIMATISYAGSESELRASIRHAMGIAQPFPLHYLRWLGVWPQADGEFRGALEGYLGDEAWR